MHLLRSKCFLVTAAIAGLYVGAFVAIKLGRPSFLTSSDGPGRTYCAVFLPLRFASASTQEGYWKSRAGGHWQTVKVVWNNPGNGYLEFDDRIGRPGRVFAGFDLSGTKEGEVIDIHLRYKLQTWDDFSDHLIPGIDKVERSTSRHSQCRLRGMAELKR